VRAAERGPLVREIVRGAVARAPDGWAGGTGMHYWRYTTLVLAIGCMAAGHGDEVYPPIAEGALADGRERGPLAGEWARAQAASFAPLG